MVRTGTSTAPARPLRAQAETVVVVLHALSVTYAVIHEGLFPPNDWGLSGLTWSSPVVQIAIGLAAWANVVAWSARWWGICAACSLATSLAMWGFVYSGPLLAVVLYLVAGVRFARGFRHHRHATDAEWKAPT